MKCGRATRWLMMALLAALALSIVGNIWLFNLNRTNYRGMHQVHLDPLGLVANPPEPTDALAHPGQTLVVFYGDSRAQAWTPPGKMPGYRFVNRGIGAQTTEQVLARFDAHIAPLQPDVIVVQVGINDLKTLPLFADRQEAIIQRCKENIEAIVDRSRASGAQVILTTIFPVGQIPLARRLVWTDDVVLAVDVVNDFIQSLHGAGVTVMKTDFLQDNSGRLRPELSADALHLNSAGYTVLNQELRTLLESMRTR